MQASGSGAAGSAWGQLLKLEQVKAVSLPVEGVLWLRSSTEVKELWEVRRLHSTRNDEKEIHKLFTEKPQR